jgi:hypothetical protein
MNPDGMSYLDVGESFFSHHWAHAVNGWWSPLYSWIVGTVIGTLKPPPRWEFPLVHVVNFLVYVATLACFIFFVRGLRRFRGNVHEEQQASSMTDWGFLLVAYAVFWWIALEVETVYDVSPDLAVAACMFLAAGVLIRLQLQDGIWRFALLGFSLGLGYWTKTIFFPLAFVTLVSAYLWRRSHRNWRRGIAAASVVFVIVSSPLIIVLSKQKGRFTFGDSGRVNYAWAVSPRSPMRNWQGREPESGTPVHPTRQLLEHPPLYEFDGPVDGTYPPWTDPSYWNEGLKAHFRLKPQIEVLMTTVPSEVRLVTRAQPGLVAGIIALAALGGISWWLSLAIAWPLLVIAVAGMAAYLPLVENDRYLGGFLLVLFLVMLWASQVAASGQAVRYIFLGMFVSIAMGTADYTVRVLTGHYAIPGVGPNSTLVDVSAAQQLWHLGLRPGDKVGIIGNGTGAYWASLAKLRIVAEIMETGHGSREFWNSPPTVKAQVYERFAASHATRVVATCPVDASADWQRLIGTPYCVRSVP